MAISADALELINILIEEEYGAIAGELLTELSLGRELPAPPSQSVKAMDQQELIDDEPIREPIPEDKQLAYACEFLMQRLVQPVVHFAEAERLASKLVADPNKLGDRPDAVQIEFLRQPDEGRPLLARSEVAGRAESAEGLGNALSALAAFREFRI